MWLTDLLVQMSRAVLAQQAHDGSFPAGHNGPYHDSETPVRNTAHWAITLLRAYEISGDAAFKDAAWKASQYLTSPAARPMGATFFSRKQPEKDFCNGLIGQAWAIEGLVAAASKLQEPAYLALARDVFLLHPFDQQTGLWRCVNVDGSYTAVDMTFNHQLLFAAAGSMLDLNPDSVIGARVRRFLDCVHTSYLRISRTGRIVHYIPVPSKLKRIPHALRPVLQSVRDLRASKYMVHKEIGYHAFNLYAFSILKQHVPTHALWHSDKFTALLRFVEQEDYVKGLENNKYGYSYNPPGFEVPLAMQVFASAFTRPRRSSRWWVEQQLQQCFDSSAMMMSKATEDALTLTARVYEATRLEDIELTLSDFRVEVLDEQLLLEPFGRFDATVQADVDGH